MSKIIKRAWMILREDGPVELGKRISRKLRASRPSTASVSPHGYLPDDETYQAWIKRSEPTEQELLLQRGIQRKFQYQPLISILAPVYQVKPQDLRETIASVRAQTYDLWELILVICESELQESIDVIHEHIKEDNRIRINLIPKNLGISGNTNEALRMAQGEYIAFLDHDDQLAPFSIFEIVKLLNSSPSLDLIYSDHDLMSSDGKTRSRPLFKPDWSPDIMLSSNYITHLTVIRTDLVRQVGGLNPDMDGAQDWDLFLRIVERTDKIGHIPQILYHWRENAGSTSQDIWAKPYAPPAQLRAIRDHLSRNRFDEAETFFDSSGFIRVKWLSNPKLKVSIIIPTRGATNLFQRCLTTIQNKTLYSNYEVIVVNNGEQLPKEFQYYQRAESDPRVKVVHFEGPFNYSKVNNFGVQQTEGDLLLFLNNDTQIISPDWLDELVMWCARKDVGAVGAKLLKPNGVIQHAGVIIGLTGFAGHIFGEMPENQWTIYGLAEWYRDFNAVTAACVMIRREVFNQVGGFNNDFILCGSDVELCLRIHKMGLRIVYNPFVKLRHLEGATRQGEIPARDFELSHLYYLPYLQTGDPFYNPNLSYWNMTPSLKNSEDDHPLKFVEKFLELDKEHSL